MVSPVAVAEVARICGGTQRWLLISQVEYMRLWLWGRAR